MPCCMYAMQNVDVQGRCMTFVRNVQCVNQINFRVTYIPVHINRHFLSDSLLYVCFLGRALRY